MYDGVGGAWNDNRVYGNCNTILQYTHARMGWLGWRDKERIEKFHCRDVFG